MFALIFNELKHAQLHCYITRCNTITATAHLYNVADVQESCTSGSFVPEAMVPYMELYGEKYPPTQYKYKFLAEI